MANLDLSKYGITGVTEILHNPSYDVLFAEETKPSLEGFEKGQVTELGAVNVMTGIYTGRSPKDKFFVKNEASADSVWWTSEEYKNDNKPCTEEAWADLKASINNEQTFAGKLFYSFSFQVSPSFFSTCLLYTSPSPRDPKTSRMPSSA